MADLHYRLINEEWLKISQDLKLAELRVLYYLRTLDPFGDRQLKAAQELCVLIRRLVVLNTA
ncbi:MAG TPA: hypothetical protein V6C84_27260 [Coleofasciculaceae cyanobacterium]|jgi:hypothetical protein